MIQLIYDGTTFFLRPLQRKLREISTKYQLFQKPANFEQRMLDCKRVLDGAKAELHILDVRDVDPEKIQTHLSGCMVRATTVSLSLFHKLLICRCVDLFKLFRKPSNDDNYIIICIICRNSTNC